MQQENHAKNQSIGAKSVLIEVKHGVLAGAPKQHDLMPIWYMRLSANTNLFCLGI